MRGRSQCTTYVYEALYRGAAPGAACRRARRSGTGRRRRHRAAWRPLRAAGRARAAAPSVSALAEDKRWTLDDPPAASWFAATLDLGWTRDPFDRLLVAHARLRGWRLATSDTVLLDRLRDAERLEV